MSERLTNILGYLTLFAILGAIWVMFGEDPTLKQGARGEATFEGLAERINEAHKVMVASPDGTVTLTRDGESWFVDQRNGYAADTNKVVALLRGVALSKRREPKTDNKARYARLGLGDKALKIELQDDTGGRLLAFDMGRRKDSPDGRSLTYISQASDTRSWLVAGLAETEANAGWWLKRPLLNVNQGRVSDVIINGTWLTRKQGDQNFIMQGLRGEEKAASYWVLADPARVIAGLTFTDVKALSNPLAEAVSTIELSTHDGLALSVKIYAMEGGHWAQVDASFDQDAQDSGPAGELADAPADGAAEAEAITNATRGWVFKLSDGDTQILTRNRDAFLEAPAE
jgi:hypothetical protein